MLNSLLIFVLTLISTNTSLACVQGSGLSGFVPENDMYISANQKGVQTGISEEEFNAVIDKVSAIYEPIIVGQGKTLDMKRLWDNGTVNASAQQSGSTWIVNMYGGLARHPSITSDGFALVVCHEIGHHLGGFPKYKSWFGANQWASTEGQSDYFANSKCLRKTFRPEDNAAVLAKMSVPSEVIEACNAQYSDETDSLICQRGAMAGLSTANLFKALRKETQDPSFTEKDAKVVSKSNQAHPATQCRMDTYFAGSLCEVDENQDVDDKDENMNVCTLKNGQQIGTRPRCWFAPKS